MQNITYLQINTCIVFIFLFCVWLYTSVYPRIEIRKDVYRVIFTYKVFTVLHCMVYYSLSLYLETKTFCFYVYCIYILYDVIFHVNICISSIWIILFYFRLLCLFYLCCINFLSLIEVIILLYLTYFYYFLHV